MFFLKHALFVSVVALSCLSTQRFATARVPQDEGMMKFLFPFSFLIERKLDDILYLYVHGTQKCYCLICLYFSGCSPANCQDNGGYLLDV
jgi:hypothetical protein